jgi:hypothetical protein
MRFEHAYKKPEIKNRGTQYAACLPGLKNRMMRFLTAFFKYQRLKIAAPYGYCVCHKSRPDGRLQIASSSHRTGGNYTKMVHISWRHLLYTECG